MLTALLFVYILNFADRVVLGILATPIKRDLHLDDTHLGLLGGTSFALFYSLFGIPVALLADRTSRVRIVGVALILWSGFTALCGTATGFWQLFLYRLGVGVGEAGGVAPSYALIADYFPVERRARAIAIYSMGIPIGLGFGVLLGAVVQIPLDPTELGGRMIDTVGPGRLQFADALLQLGVLRACEQTGGRSIRAQQQG